MLEILEIPVKIPQNKNLLLEDSPIYDEIVVIPPQNPSTNSSPTGASSSNQQLLTPSPTPENILPHMDSPLLSGSNSSSLFPIQEEIVGRLPGYRRDQVSSNLNESLILPGRTRRSAYMAALQQNNKLGGYHSAFCSTWTHLPSTPHRDSLPLFPKFWKQIVKHPYANEFKKAAEKGLESKDTFTYIVKERVTQKPLPLMWTFLYKFDENSYLFKFKARLVARGDLQYTEEDTYAATLTA